MFVIGASREADWCMHEGTGKVSCPECYSKGSKEGQDRINQHIKQFTQCDLEICHIRKHIDNEIRKHIDNEKCWCNPRLEYKDPNNNNEVWIHNYKQ